MLGFIQVNILFKSSTVQLAFTFKGQKAAEDLLKLISGLVGTVVLEGQPSIIAIEDDFACKAQIDCREISGVVLNDMDREIARGTMLRLEQEKELQKAINAERAKPENRILQPAGTPLVANA